MRSFLATTFLSICLLAPLAHADECGTSQSPLVQLLDQFSQKHGTKFAVDPRVRAKITLVGIDTETLDGKTLKRILSIHGFTALTTGDVVYVIPDSVAEVDGASYGTEWDG